MPSLICRMSIVAFRRRSSLLVSTMPAHEVNELAFSPKNEAHEVTTAVATDLRIYAGQRWPTMNHKWRKARLASLLGMNERRVKSIYEAEHTARLRADEEARIKALIGQKEEADAADIALAKRIADLEAQVATLAAILARDTLEAEGHAAHRHGAGALGSGQAAPRRRSTDH
jgi:hypothetical protein